MAPIRTAAGVLRAVVLGLLLVLWGLAAPRDAPGYATCYGCVGWDGPGLGSATLSYYFGSLTHDNGLTDGQVKGTVVSAMQAWSSVADVIWVETSLANQRRSVDIQWTTGSYGGIYGGTFPSSALAVAYYPVPPTFETIAGDIYFNEAFTWSVNGGSGYDIFSVALHEVGHALGLAHSTNPNSAMYAYYRKVTGLHADDISGILSLYSAPPPPTPPQSLPPPVVYFTPTNPSSPVPEPGALFLLGSGLIGLGAWAWKKGTGCFS